MRTRTTGLCLAVAALAFVGASCSSADDDDAGDGTAPSSPVSGGEAPADTDAPEETTADTGSTGTTGTTPGEEVQTGESLLDTVIANDTVRCGVRDDLPGFATLDDAGDHVGFDADFCRVIAAAVLGDADAGRVRRPRDRRTGSPRCSRARSTCSSATPPGPPAVTAPRARRSSTRRSTTARA